MFSAATAHPPSRIDVILELHKTLARHTAHILSSSNIYRRRVRIACSESTSFTMLGFSFGAVVNPCTLPAATYLHSLILIEVHVRCAFQCLFVGCASAVWKWYRCYQTEGLQMCSGSFGLEKRWSGDELCLLVRTGLVGSRLRAKRCVCSCLDRFEWICTSTTSSYV
jgi:hypothetical protein